MTTAEQVQEKSTPLFKVYVDEWLELKAKPWKYSYRKRLEETVQKYLIPYFGEIEIGKIGENQIVRFREAATSRIGGKKLSGGTVNGIILPLRLILKDAAGRFGFESPIEDLRRLSVARPDVDPFSLSEVLRFVKNVHEEYRGYYLIRFFTGMKDSEVNGLKWRYVDFANRTIHIRETLVAGRLDFENRDELRRTIHMGQAVFTALKGLSEQNAGRCEFVFSSSGGTPLNSNVTTNIWYPTLNALRLRRRRPHQIRHTTAALWLSSGEDPEWVAGQLGCSSVKALLAMYWRYLPTGTCTGGKAFDKMLSKHLFHI
jgi:integrase